MMHERFFSTTSVLNKPRLLFFLMYLNFSFSSTFHDVLVGLISEPTKSPSVCTASPLFSRLQYREHDFEVRETWFGTVAAQLTR